MSIDDGSRKPAVALPVRCLIHGEANEQLVSFTPEDNRNQVYQTFGQSKDTIPVSEEIWDDVLSWPGKETCSSN